MKLRLSARAKSRPPQKDGCGSTGRRLALGCAVALGLIALLVAPVDAVLQSPVTPTPGLTDDEWVEELMARMTAADKVGQLFLVTFRGADAGPDSEIARLVQELRVGGVVVDPANENFRNDGSTPQQVLELTTSLQRLAFSDSAPVIITETVPVTFTSPLGAAGQPPEATPEILSTTLTITQVITFSAQSVPLFIGVTEEGDGYPYTSLRSGFTELPSPMGVGATWNDRNAEEVGAIVGREVSAVGANLLLGPSLDVLVEPPSATGGGLATRVFGGDPYWTGRMGRAYISGVHKGSQGRVATAAKHLPGLGGSNRSLEEEVATVYRSLQSLRLIELPPFFAVTAGGTITETTDALMTAHLRYAGFQGNIYYVTPPISLHAQGMEQLMGLSELATWRQDGGLLISDSLGVPAVRRYYSPNLNSFPHRQIALDAFLAGNDVLNLSRFSLNDSWPEQMANIEDTIRFFRNKYEADPNFRDLVDQSVRRILLAKKHLCPGFVLDSCTGTPEGLAGVGGSQSATGRIAQEGVTLLYPSADELPLRMPRAPSAGEEIVIFTDGHEARECEDCEVFYLLAPGVLRETMLRLYGPQATGQVTTDHVRSYTLGQLRTYLESGKPGLDAVIRDADWIIFGLLTYSPDADADSRALRQFLRERATGSQSQKIVVLAFQAPYYLDTTDVSKLTAYYGVYSRIQPSIEAAIRAIFLEYRPSGRSPVTVTGVGYDLLKQVAPDPDQVIQVLAPEQPAAPQATPQPLGLKVGDALEVRTSVILDGNGNPVPDGTPVVFRYVFQGEGLGGQKDAVTVNGVARATITLEREGELQITATSQGATNSMPLLVRLSGGTSEIVTPTPSPTPTPTPTLTSSPTPTPTETPSLTPSPTSTPPSGLVTERAPLPRVRWTDLLLGCVGFMTAGTAVYLVGRRLEPQTRSSNTALRLALWSGVCGLLGYLFYGLALPGTGFLGVLPAGLRGLLVGLVCGLFPFLAVAWRHWQRRRSR